MTWDAYVHLAFDEIRLAGAGAPQVARRLQAVLRDLCAIAPQERRPVLKEQLELLSLGSAGAFEHEEDVTMAQHSDPGGINTTAGAPRSR